MQHLFHRLGTTVLKIQKSVVATVIMAYQAAMQDAQKLCKGPWLEEEDKRLTATVALLGERRWDAIARASGLRRSGKSCRLRWLNYLRPNLKHDPISLAEEKIILQLHEQWGNKWSRIARRLPGRTDNEIKNYWRTHLRKKTQSQDQGHISDFMDNAKQDLMIQNHDTNATETSYQDCNSAAGTWETTDTDSFEVLGSSLNSSIANSPYESRISDWVLGFSDDKTGFDHYGDCTSSKDQDSYFNIYPPLNTAADETSLWDCSDSLWDLD